MAEKNNEFPARIITLPVYARDPYAAQEGYDLAPPEESDGTQRTLHDYIELLITYRWPVASVILTVLFGTLLYNLLATPLYTSEAKLKISLYSPVLPGARLEDALRQQTRENEYFQTETELASSLTLAERVLSSPEIEADVRAYLRRRTGLFSVFAPFLRLLRKDKGQETAPASPGGYSFPVNLLQAYLGLVQVQPVRKTSLVTISVTTADPVLSAKIANRHSESFIELSREERQRAVLENLLFLKNQADELGDKVSQAERNLAAYAEENALVTDPKGESITLKRTAELSQLLTQATARRIQSESIFNGAKSGAGADSTSLDDSSLQNLRLRLKEVEAEYAMLSEKFAPGYPKMVQLQSRIAELRENIREQRAQALNALEGRYRADLEAEAELKRQLEIQKSSGFDQARREVQYNSMKREYESLKELYQSVLRQVKETQVSAAGQGTNISLADRAAVPMGHSSPRRMMNIIFAMLCGPLMGISLALLLDALDNTFKSPEQLQAVLNLPVLGVVPSFLAEVGLEKDFAAKTASFASSLSEKKDDAGIAEKEDRPFVTISAPRSFATESYRVIRTAILLSSADNPPKTLLVTSAKKGEGKTTFILNLAAALSQAGSKTLVVDADLRRPSVGRYFSIPSRTAGLADFLAGMKELDEVLRSTPIDRLFIIPAGSEVPNPAELIGSRKMAELLRQLAEQYDYVLVDTPPVLPATDAVSLSHAVDGVVLVVRGHVTVKHMARQAALRLKQVNARILGVVLNGINLRSGHYYYYYRDAFASYYAEDVPRKFPN